MVIAKPQPIDAGGSNSSTNSDDEFTVTTHDDPFSGNTGGGKTGTEIIAEGGAPEAGVTNDPHETSVSEKFDDPKNAIDAVVDRAQDGDDGSSVNFDATPANKQGKSDLKDSVESVVEATTSGGSNDSGGDVPSQAETAARNAANSVSQAVPDLSGGGDGGGLKAALLALAGIALVMLGGS